MLVGEVNNVVMDLNAGSDYTPEEQNKILPQRANQSPPSDQQPPTTSNNLLKRAPSLQSNVVTDLNAGDPSVLGIIAWLCCRQQLVAFMKMSLDL